MDKEVGEAVEVRGVKGETEEGVSSVAEASPHPHPRTLTGVPDTIQTHQNLVVTAIIDMGTKVTSVLRLLPVPG